jgi:alkylation response protein AidB-like acyl-CoA dehydrogenase
MLDNVKVPVENVLGPIGQGHKVALNVLNFGRVKLGSRNMSGVKLALGHAVKYAKDRRQFGRAIAEFGLIKEKLAGMAVRAFVGDAMSYRTLGDVDRALDAIDRHETTHVMKTIEGFAVECSINKVWTSEALAWAVDQAVQVFGGNGYSREFPVERMYRDARITRIYEGTNEINRMLIPMRLLKQLPEVFAGFAARRAFDDRPAHVGGPFAVEREAVARAKVLATTLLGRASASYGDGLKEAQEIQAEIADILIEVYAAESAVARAEKLAADHRAALAADIARVFVDGSVSRILQATKEVAAALAGRDGAAHDLADLVDYAHRLTPCPGVDTIAARRRIADAVIAAERFPF